jgi:ABC-type transport system involved in cytochrome c biogenesis permease subunit
MGISHICFGLSYLTAFGLEAYRTVHHARWSRIAGIVFAVAGLLAHTIFLAYHQPSPASPYGSILLLAWVFGVVYVYGLLHRDPHPWAVFVLPLVLILVAISFWFQGSGQPDGSWFSGEHFWGMFHGVLLLLASVGITMAFLASAMYLVQAARLRRKRNPIGGMKLLSLERLERINRRAINLAFPMLTVGLLLGAMRAWQNPLDNTSWTALKITSTMGLWLVAALLMYLRYGAYVSGRRLAWFTILAFCLMLVALGASHPFVPGEPR